MDLQTGHVIEIWRFPVKSMAGERLDHTAVGARGLWGDRGWAVRNEDTGEIHNGKRFPILMQCSAVYRGTPSIDHIPEVDVTLPDGTTLGSDSPALPTKLSELLGRRVSLRRPQPASDKVYYRRREPGSALMGRLARYGRGRRFLQWGIEHGMGGEVKHEFARDAGEPMPDLTNIPPELFEFQTPPGTYFDVFPIHLLTSASLRSMALRNPAADWDVRRFRPNVLIQMDGDPSDHIEKHWTGHTVRIGTCVVKGEIPTVRCAMPVHAQSNLPRDPSVLRTIVRDANQCLGLYASVIQPGAITSGDAIEIADGAGFRGGAAEREDRGFGLQ